MISIELKSIKNIVLIMAWLLVSGSSVLADEIGSEAPSATYTFTDSEKNGFLDEHKAAIQLITEATIEKMRIIMPELAGSIHFNFFVVDRDLSMVNGATGRADRPTEIEISLSSIYEGGVDKAINDGLEGTLFHELHHTVRGWTIYGNKFDQGIDIAAVNEGLADVFAEIQVGHPMNRYSDAVDFDAWAREIIALPKNANYGEWMFLLPDGREALGYRTGSYLIKKAMVNSGKGIVELSTLSVSALYELAGY